MHEAFAVHMLTDDGKMKAAAIADAFDKLLDDVEFLIVPADQDTVQSTARLLALVRTKLEEACFFAKKAMAENHAQT